MKIRRRFALVVVLSAMFMLTTGTAHAGYARHYDVYNIYPGPSGYLAGQWDLDCDGNWTGWGWEPGHDWSYDDVTLTDYCGPGVG